LSARLRFGIAACVVVLAIVGLIGFSISGATAYYRTPAEMKAGSYRPNERIRVAGVVTKDTIVHNGAVNNFTIEDGKATLPIPTSALLPDTFTAGVTVVAEGSMTGRGVFDATDVLAKCHATHTANGSS